MLRRYWHPIAVANEITDEHPTKFVRVLGEDLVIFEDKSGRVGLLADKCSHRNASLVYGRVEERGISCAYHGWLYDCEGNILETPPERNDAIMKSVKQKAYSAMVHVGLVFAYLGPTPVPPIPHYVTMFRPDGHRKIVVFGQLDCNWLQSMENAADPAHAQILHQEYMASGRQLASTTRGLIDEVQGFDVYLTDYGIMKKRTHINGAVDEHPLIFPSYVRQGQHTQIRTPIDDEHTLHIHLDFTLTEDGSEPPDAWVPEVIEYRDPCKEPADALYPVAHFTQPHIIGQDHMAWETQGPVADRTREHLSYSDRGVVLFRRMVKEQIETVQRGEDPIGVFRDPDHPTIDTKVDEDIWSSQRIEEVGYYKRTASDPASSTR
jgi:5,5'-dehydrodivanillate O-demethylase